MSVNHRSSLDYVLITFLNLFCVIIRLKISYTFNLKLTTTPNYREFQNDNQQVIAPGSDAHLHMKTRRTI